MIVYQITNTITGKIYIGKTTGLPEKRWRLHVYNAFHTTRGGKLYEAIRKYGQGAFEVIGLACPLPGTSLDDLEILLIAQYDCVFRGYNIMPGGEGGANPAAAKRSSDLRRGRSYIEQYGHEKASLICEKKSKSMQGVFTGRECHWKEKTSKGMKDRYERDPDLLNRITEINRSKALRGDKHPMFGKQHTPEAIAKISASSRGRLWTDKRKLQFSKDNQRENNGFYKNIAQIDILNAMIDNPSATMKEHAAKFSVSLPTMGKKAREIFGVSNMQTLRKTFTSEPDWLLYLEGVKDDILYQERGGGET